MPRSEFFDTLPAVDESPRPVTLAIGGLVALAAAMGIGRFIYTPILPTMAEELGLSQGEAGLIASANFAGYLAGALLAALPRLPGSRRAWLIGAVAASALTTGAMAAGTSLAFFVTMRFAGGIASAFVLVFSSALILDRLAASGRPDLSALHFAGVGTGIAVSAALVSVLAAGGADWRRLWIGGALVSLAAVALVPHLVPGGADTGRAASGRSVGGDGRRLARLILAYGLFGFGYVVTATFIVSLVRTTAAMRPFEPVVWLAVGLAAAPSVALWTAVGRRIGTARAFAAACLVEAVGVAASVLWTSGAGAVLSAALLGGTFMGLTALGLAGARHLSGGDPRRTLALMTASFGLGQIVGPAFAGWAHDSTGSFTMPTITAAGALLLAALLALGTSEAERRAQGARAT